MVVSYIKNITDIAKNYFGFTYKIKFLLLKPFRQNHIKIHESSKTMAMHSDTEKKLRLPQQNNIVNFRPSIQKGCGSYCTLEVTYMVASSLAKVAALWI